MAVGAANEGKDVVTSDANNALTLSLWPVSPKKLAVIGKGMQRNNLLLSHVLQADVQRWYPWSSFQQSLLSRQKKHQPEAFIGWGNKKSFKRAHKAALRQDLNTLSIEDGFLRSLDSGISSRHGLSVIVDDIGIYFDLTRDSRLEQLIVHRIKRKASVDERAQDKRHAQKLMQRICIEKLSKYNAVIDSPSLDALAAKEAHSKPTTSPTVNSSKPHVLLIDQVSGDASVKGAGAGSRQFKQMLKTACRRHPDAHIWIKAHPASQSGYLTRLRLPKNVKLLTQAMNPIALLSQVEHVYTVSSHMGFEALMLGKQVHCFGVNWYSGWGLTDDSCAPKRLLKTVKQRRMRQAQALVKSRKKSNPALFPKTSAVSIETTLETLFYSAYIDYSRYVDPASKQACTIDTAIEWLVTNRDWQARLAGNLTVFEFSRWKLPFVRAFVDLPRINLFVKPKPRLKNLLHPDHFRVNYQQPLLVWGLAKRQQLQKRWQDKNSEKGGSLDAPIIYCMEDGFVRSNGLGATLLAPLSVVVDKQGIYYDATRPSDLESLLRHCQPLSLDQTVRVRQLQKKLLTQRVSKYNVGMAIEDQSASWMQAAKVSKQRRILIVGQVEDDLSVQYCGSLIKTNSDLIKRVRQDNPNAYLIYKPHPDVEAGLRAGKVTKDCLDQVQAVAHDTAMPDCLEWVDEIHTISSLTGFEALLRGLDVTCYGLPFYAGWGLTTDMDKHLSPKSDYLKRRQRAESLSLEQLIYNALIQYPLYRLPDGYGLAQIEQVIDYLYPLKDADGPKGDLAHSSLVQLNLVQPSAVTDNTTLPAKGSILRISTLPARMKRTVTIRFMQQRHQWQQRLRKLSR